MSIGAGKVFDKIQYPLMIKTLRRTGTQGNFLHVIKHIYKNLQLTFYTVVQTTYITLYGPGRPTASAVGNGERLNTAPLRRRTRRGCLLSRLLVHTVLE